MSKPVWLDFSCSEEVAVSRGEAIAEALGLEKNPKGKYIVEGKPKRPAGLYRSLIRIAYETKEIEV